MLGDAWKRLNPTEKEVYTAEAHMRAEEYRRLFPDCWKRKRFSLFILYNNLRKQT